MKFYIIMLISTFLSTETQGQVRGEFIPLGNLKCLSKDNYIDSTNKAYQIYYIDKEINESPYLIDIHFSQTGSATHKQIFARIYLDSVFKMYYITSMLRDDGNYDQDTSYPPRTLNLSTVFEQLVANGIFSLPLISTDSLQREWKATVISKAGELSQISTDAAGGNQYIITTKVKNCYRQYIFDNPDIYSEAYVDNSIFKNQNEIVKIIMSSYK